MEIAINLSEVAKQVRSSYRKLDEAQIVGRVMLITGKKFPDALQVCREMYKADLFKNFVDKETAGKLRKVVANNPGVQEFLELFDLIPQKLSVCPPKAYSPPQKFDPEEIKKALNLGTF